jgi:hypothetical protein
MDYELLYTIASFSIIPAWALLIFLPKHKLTNYVVYSYAYPYFLGLAYAYFIISNLGDAGMGSLQELRRSFDNDAILLAAWIHYLIFDLFVGSWMVRDAEQNKINHLKITPVLVFTLMVGPIGLLVYLVMRQFERKKV